MPGLYSLSTYTQSKYATLTALQNSITNINTTINSEIQNLQTEINNIDITNPQNVSKNLSFHTSHTDFMYQANTTNNDNRRQFVIQNHYPTYQRKCNHELQIQALNTIIADLQNQINNLSSGGGGNGGGGEIGTMCFNKKANFIHYIYIYIYIQICGYKYVDANICIYPLN